MDFELSKEQQDIRQAAREFALGELKDIAADCDQNETYPPELIKKAGELGFLGVFIDEESGGAGLGFLEHAIILEEFWKVDPGPGATALFPFPSVPRSFCCSGRRNRSGNTWHRWRKATPSWDLPSPNRMPGSDTLSAATSAVLDGDEYRINGSKVMIGNGAVGDFLLVFCLTDPDEKKSSKRHSIIVVETDRPGYEADYHARKNGASRIQYRQCVSFGCSGTQRESGGGRGGNGFAQLMAFFDRSRAYVAAHGVGLSQGALDLALAHVRSREQFGRKIGSFQATQFKIADMATRVELARTLTHKACTLLDQGKGNTNTTAMAKMFAARTAVEVVDEALQLHGGYGYFNEQDVERFYRGAKVLEIYEGAKEVEKMIIGRNVIGRL